MRVWTVVCLVVCAFIASDARAQTASGGSIRGYVKDEQEAVLPGVRLTATSPDAPGDHTTTSDGTGYYRLLDLPPGTYEVIAELDGFARWARGDVIVRAGLNINMPVVMKVGNRSETVEVKADSPLLESRNASQSLNVTGELQRDLPLSGRRFWGDATSLAPGVMTREANNNTQWFYVHGAEFKSNRVVIDGGEVTSSAEPAATSLSFPVDAIQDVKITTSGVNASAPLGLGAGFNVVTRSGGDRYHGNTSGIFRPQSWNGNNTPGGSSAAASVAQPEGSFGGPVVREREWIFSAVRFSHVNTSVNRTSDQLNTLRALFPSFSPFDDKANSTSLFAKTTSRISSSQSLLASYTLSRDKFTSSASNFTRPSGIDTTGGGFNTQLTSTWSSRFVSSLGLSFNNMGTALPVEDFSQPRQSIFRSTVLSAGKLSGTALLAVAGSDGTQATIPTDSNVAVTLDSHSFFPGGFGSHDIEAGVYYQRLGLKSDRQYVNGGFATEELVLKNPSDPGQGFVPFHRRIYDSPSATTTSLTIQDFAAYIQDSWHPWSRVTLQYGVRVDDIRQRDRLFDVRTESTIAVGPRVGVNVQIDRQGRSTVRAAVGRVHEAPAQTSISAGSNVVGFRDLYDLNLGGSFQTIFVTPGARALARDRIIDTGSYHQPYSLEYVFGWTRQLGGGFAVDVTGYRRSFKDRTALVDTNSLYGDGQFLGYRDPSLNEIYLVTNNSWNVPVITGLDFTATKQRGWWQLIGSYSRQFRRLNGVWQPGDPAAIVQPGAFANDRGIGSPSSSASSADQANSLTGGLAFATQWQDHVVRLGSNVHLPAGVIIAMNYTWQSGPWSGPVFTTITYDGRFGPALIRLSNGRLVSNPLATAFRIAGADRSDAQFTLASYETLNFRASKRIALRDRALELSADVFNLTNSDAVQALLSGANQTISSNFGQGTSRQLPRAAQLSARFIF